MAFINNGHIIKKDYAKIICWNFRNKGHYANDCPEKKTETDTDTDASRQSVRNNMTNVIRGETMMLQEGLHNVKFDGDDMFSAFYFFNAVHEPMNPE